MASSGSVSTILASEPPINRIPNEILGQIFECLPKDYPRTGGLYSVCLVNKRFCLVGVTVLYQRLLIRFDHPFGISPERLEALENFPASAGKYVKEIHLERQKPTMKEIVRRDCQMWESMKRDSIQNINKTLDTVESFVARVLSGNVFRKIRVDIGETYGLDLRILSEYNVPLLSIMIRARAIPALFLQDVLEEFFRPRDTPYAGTLICSRGPNSPTAISEIGMDIIETDSAAICALDLAYKHKSTLESLFLTLPPGQTMIPSMLVSKRAKELFRSTFNDLTVLKEDPTVADPSAFPAFPALKKIFVANLDDDLKPHMDILKLLVPVQNLTKLRLCGCRPQGPEYAAAFRTLVNLKELALVDSGTVGEISAPLKQLQPHRLEVLTLRFSPDYTGSFDPKYPARGLILKHAKTLRILWLESRSQGQVNLLSNLSIPELAWPSSQFNVCDLNQLPRLEELCASIDHEGLAKLMLPRIRQIQLMDSRYHEHHVNKEALTYFVKRHKQFAGRRYQLEVMIWGDNREHKVFGIQPNA
ncbi:hypothetical protein TWF696_004592 [Orbilia brochopaga]|uniref:F-box domain-containing protein n=1 Tax=Orbilia brochopaga TaxID=3140254 RepID=A0AAV9V905_9PEZI